MLGEEKDPKWMQNLWRPAMGWMYMLICLLDMAIFPVAWSLLQAMMHVPITQWNPLTLQGAGLFHIAMGAVLGIAAFGRTQEKLGGANNGGLQTPSIAPNASFGTPTSFNPPTSGNFESRFNGTSAQDFQQPMSVTVGFGGRMAPPPAPQPFI